jgi:hypothetical protein
VNGQDMRMPCDAEALLNFVYDECQPDERRRMAAHLDTCAACADEVAGLRDARTQLAAWAPPEAVLGFTISAASSPATVLAPVATHLAWWRRPTPVWAQAVAAAVLFGVGLAMGSRQVASPATEARTARTAAPAVAGGPAVTAVTTEDLARVEATLRNEISRTRAATVSVATPTPQRNDEVLRQVRELLRDSEQQQQNALDVRVAQLARDAEIQRRVDQANLQRTVMQIQGTTGEEVRQQREMLNYLVNVSQRGAGR